MYQYAVLERAKHSSSLSYSLKEFAPMFLLVWVTQTLSAYYLYKLSPYTPNRLQMPMYKGIDDGV